ncbi:hypothetical protein I2485_06820 [Nesterenkonia sp. E16_7]|uniref:hypothetical protein n=1 Tax=unclassified Nesterenkonia TaxID=2629769 RepID=UPI001A919CF8|nr:MULTISPECIES: hypothetical protein [unclassified Nesterenkonia]MBO0596587.1 hypothetical protein [Nesterenkonia sp. E16_10]MBO0598364.1 hypothetical protein [Nesterenkonia sp. E16_7]
MRPLVEYTRTTITRLRAQTITDNNAEIQDWSQPQERPLEDAKVDPAGTDEDNTRGEARQSRYTVQLPDEDADITGTDRIKLPGDDRQWRIVGQPLVQPSMTGIGYVQFEIQIWEG